jgi:hypothetical protein
MGVRKHAGNLGPSRPSPRLRLDCLDDIITTSKEIWTPIEQYPRIIAFGLLLI